MSTYQAPTWPHEAVEVALEVLAPVMADTRRVADYPEHIRNAHRAWSGDFTGRAEMVDRMFMNAALTAALSAAVPVEVAREVARLLGEVRAVVDMYFDLTLESWHEDATPEPEDVWRFHRDLRAVLDTVGAPAQVDEAATGGQADVEWVVNPHCAERFDEAGLHDYHPLCCRFPKSCSAWEPKS